MIAKEIMNANPVCCTPNDTAQAAARLMHEHDCGSLPVVEDKGSLRLVGIVTDRDLTIRVLADGKGPTTRVDAAMTPDPETCLADDDLELVQRTMADMQLRRLLVVDVAGRCVGIIAQADLARAASQGESVSPMDVARVVERISEPSRERDRRDADGIDTQPRI
jgi:CBS domain-containing protein